MQYASRFADWDQSSARLRTDMGNAVLEDIGIDRRSAKRADPDRKDDGKHEVVGVKRSGRKMDSKTTASGKK